MDCAPVLVFVTFYAGGEQPVVRMSQNRNTSDIESSSTPRSLAVARPPPADHRANMVNPSVDIERHRTKGAVFFGPSKQRRDGMSSKHHGEYDFNEVVLDDVLLADEALIGKEGDGWKQVTSELAFERSGPERFLSHLGLMEELVAVLQKNPSERGLIALGRLTAHLFTLRRLSRSVATMISAGKEPSLQAAIVKDLGRCSSRRSPRSKG